jgi:lysine 6-dehydrogenase
MKIAVLGAGMVGSEIALDLANDHSVSSFDFNKANLDVLKEKNSSVETIAADLSQYLNYNNWFSPFDIVVIAVPGFMGYKTLESVINAGKNVVDISFFHEDALQLDKLAKEKGVTAITDCGVAPGISNLILGRYNEEMKIKSFTCYVGGLPQKPKPPFYYKAPFSPMDVIQEYIRPARIMEKGKTITKPALSDREILSFDEIGELEAFNTDGLRSLIYTMSHIPDMIEKTLRYKGHADLIIALKESGFFDSAPFQINGADIIPVEFTSKILVKEWKPDPKDEEFTVMKLILKSDSDNIEFFLLDRYDETTKTSSMARTTGYTCTAVVNLIVKNKFNEKGVFPPELIGKNKNCFDFVMEYLKDRGVVLKKSILPGG